MKRPKHTGASPASIITSKQRREKCLELRIGGASKRAIAREVGISDRQVGRLLDDAIDTLNKSCNEKAEHVKRIELERLDKMTLALFTNRNSPRVTDSLLRIMEQRAKLLGLYEPEKKELSGPNGQPLEFVDKTEEVRAKLFRNGVEVLPVLKDEK